ncbi:hypothetical protein BJ742DRAFT_840195 [Cladochytrium replicatum]|nr:hypothetical protein BJ742DRAFT_840195 [Cladochytrium replicatum]
MKNQRILIKVHQHLHHLKVRGKPRTTPAIVNDELNTSCRSLSRSAQAVEGEGEADNQGSFTAAEPTSELGMAQDAARVRTDTRFSLSIHSYYKPEKRIVGGVEVEYDFCIKCQQMKKIVRYKVISSSTTNQRVSLATLNAASCSVFFNQCFEGTSSH